MGVALNPITVLGESLYTLTRLDKSSSDPSWFESDLGFESMTFFPDKLKCEPGMVQPESNILAKRSGSVLLVIFIHSIVGS